MDGLFPAKALWSFGPSSLDPLCEAPDLARVSGKCTTALRAKIREQCPRRPGVYGMVGPKGELLYVGKAKYLRSRLLSYFRSKSRDAKAGRILQHSKSIVWEYTPSEFAALLRELELIHRWRPRFNVQGQPGRRSPTYVCLGRQPAPYAFLSRQPPAGALAAFGPIPGGERAQEAVRFLNDCFRLRDCPRAQEMVFADQTELFPIARTAGCLRYEIGTCMGPCLGACERAAYMTSVRAAKAFLAGTDLVCLKTLEQAMSEASAALNFERAAALRDKWESLRWLHQRLERLRQAFVYPVEGFGGKDLWYLIQGGRVVASIPAPQSMQEKEGTGRIIAAAFPPENRWTRTVPVSAMDSVLLVAAWFRRHPEEQARIFCPKETLAAPLAKRWLKDAD
jgi:excinuclease ABC subunit C